MDCGIFGRSKAQLDDSRCSEGETQFRIVLQILFIIVFSQELRRLKFYIFLIRISIRNMHQVRHLIVRNLCVAGVIVHQVKRKK